MKNSLKIPLGIIIFLIFFLGGITYCSARIYQGIKNFPAYAEKDVVYTKYKTMLDGIDELASSSSSQLEFAAKLEKMDHPDELMYLAVGQRTDFGEEDTVIAVIDKRPGTTSSTFLKNHVGHGVVNGQEIIIIEHSLSTDYDVDLIITYLKH